MNKKTKCALTGLLTMGMLLGMSGCGTKTDFNIVEQGSVEKQEELVLYSPTARGNEVQEGGVMDPMQLAIDEFEESHPGLVVSYKSYTPQDYQEKSYDDVVRDRLPYMA